MWSCHNELRDMPRTRRPPRLPLSQDDILADRRYYSKEDLDTILATLPNGDAVDRERFARDLDDAADWFCALAHGIAEHETAPSLKTRRWDALLKGLDRAQAGLQGFPGGELAAAAEGAVRRPCENGRNPHACGTGQGHGKSPHARDWD